MGKLMYEDFKHRLRPLSRMRKYMLIFNELEIQTNSEQLLMVDKETKLFDVPRMNRTNPKISTFAHQTNRNINKYTKDER